MPSRSRMEQFSIFAIDDLQLRPEQCEHNYNYPYTFDNMYEDLQLETIRPIKHSIGRVKADNPPGPQGNYFLFQNENSFANYIYTDTISILNVPADEPSKFSCVRFLYQTNGNVTLKIYSVVSDSYDYGHMPPEWTASNLYV